MDKLRQILQAHPHVIVFRPSCPYSQKALEYSRQNAHKIVFALMSTNDYPQLHQDLAIATGQATVPYVFVNGNLIGGWDQLSKLAI